MQPLGSTDGGDKSLSDLLGTGAAVASDDGTAVVKSSSSSSEDKEAVHCGIAGSSLSSKLLLVSSNWGWG